MKNMVKYDKLFYIKKNIIVDIYKIFYILFHEIYVLDKRGSGYV